MEESVVALELGTRQVEGIGAVEVYSVSQDDPLAAPLIAELALEYSSRYGGTREAMLADLTTYPAEEFAYPQGALLVLTHEDVPIAGGAFRQFDSTTAELKRIWTSVDYRKRGLGKVVVRELEREIELRGYHRVFLTTGPRQPEAVALYLSSGYTPLYDASLSPEEVGVHPFEKQLRVLENVTRAAIPTDRVDNTRV
ncbi:GNAT family N-acetyltransferase [Rhodococcus sp. NPDC060176]|uniref:GNAT family N-acetyltransferase n=1 Tax=Rhodococcus sp. NPDC060176 TaxID=3347062 RepID=UPI0036557827